MSCIFEECKSLICLHDISKWKTSNIKDMHDIISKCEKIKSLPDISKWNT